MPVHETYNGAGQVISRVEVPCTIEEVKREAQRRIMLICGAATMEDAVIRQINAANAGDTRVAAKVLAIRAASDIIEQSPPVEVCIDPRWPADAVTVDDVAAERDRRLALGFDYAFGGARGTHRIGTTKADLEGWSEVSTYAGALIDSGDLTTQIAIATDTGPCLVTAPEWRAIEIASAAYRQPLWAKSFALMAQTPIPADYTHDRHWT